MEEFSMALAERARKTPIHAPTSAHSRKEP